ncbi:MAG: hypothetical protein U0163_16355 [Gemmatimonadaceae bacterium]
MRTAFALLGALVLLAIASPAQASGFPADTVSTARSDSTTTVEVRNQAFLDAVVYAVRDGVSYRLGIATGNTTSKFTVPRYLDQGLYSLTFVIHPIGGRRNSVSDEVMVNRGDVIELTIPPF